MHICICMYIIHTYMYIICVYVYIYVYDISFDFRKQYSGRKKILDVGSNFIYALNKRKTRN